ncbi:hypothetical protein [Endozoicomonas sp. GU-1]|uniref:hypothetical protein n=1 Tax=Endozoicomonas sp. GU-1 TaxID=3009078 RepID=UPI0022B4EA2C|nr:hypothetical protein [Endozoicomonas sp. GU-1]WBA82466.1 hypothetical protein O2T12_04770 [Endozoicomonas sp. GU-1]WBA85400.1 hypothetical protein O3276_19450 [Endozoicomonas sp. GU-1]
MARLENRQCLLTINVRARVEDGSVSATHIDGGPIAQQQTMGSSLAGPVHTATTDQPSQTEPEAGPDNDSSVRPETTAQGLTDASPADQDIAINSADTGGDTAPLDDIAVAVTFDNPVIGNTSLMPGIMQGSSGQTDSATDPSAQPDATQQTGGTGEDYNELDGVAGLFAEPADSANQAVLDSGLATGEVDQSDTESLKAEEEWTQTTSAGDVDSGLGGVAESDVDAESMKTEVESTETTSAGVVDSGLGGVAESDVDAEPIRSEVDPQPIENEDNTQSIETEADTQTIETKAKSTEKTSVEEDYSELDGIEELFAEPEVSSDSTALDDNQEEDYSELDGIEKLFAEPESSANNAALDSGLSAGEVEQSDAESLKTEEELTEATSAEDGDSGLDGVVAESDVDAGSIRNEVDPQPIETEADTQSIENEDNTQSIENEDDTQTIETKAKSTEQTSVEEDYSELDGIEELFAEPEVPGDSSALDDNQEEDYSELDGIEKLFAEPEVPGDSNALNENPEPEVFEDGTSPDENPQPEVSGGSTALEDNQQIDVSASERSGDNAPIDSDTITVGDDQIDVDTESPQAEAELTEKTLVDEGFSEPDEVTDIDDSERSESVMQRSDESDIDSDTTTVGDDQIDVDTESPQAEAELTEETLVDEGFTEPDEVTDIDDSERSESVMQRSDDSDVAQASIPDETEFTAESSEPQDSVSDSDYFSDDEGDLGTTQTLSPEPDFATDVAKESAPMERAEVVRQSTANIGEIARRRKESLRAASAPASTTPSPAPSSPAPRPAPSVVNKPVDVSGVKSVVAGQINTTRNAKSTDAIPKEERARDKKTLGVSSTYNEASVIENAFDKLQKNAGNLKVSKDIAKTARKYIATEAQDGGRFLAKPTAQQKKALAFLGLKDGASERAIRLALLNKASESAESGNSRKHDSAMKTLSKHHSALFNK